MVKKFGRRLVAIAAAALMVTASAAPAFAAGYSFRFNIARGSGNRFDTTTETRYKAYDGDDHWYFTPQSGSWNPTTTNTWAYVVWTNRPGTPSGYRNPRAYQRYDWNYQQTPAGGSALLCEIKEQSRQGYDLSGVWCP